MATDGQGHDIPANCQAPGEAEPETEQDKRPWKFTNSERQVFLSVSSEMTRCNIAHSINKPKSL